VPTKSTLPPGILMSDLKYPEPDNRVYDAGDHGQLTFYNTQGFGWCIATLLISRSTRGTSDRTYAIRVSDGAGVRIGLGPHVTDTVSIYLRKDRMEALKKYVDLYQQGAIKANTTRDRISSRRAEGVERRAAGQRSWTWRV
jgi:hypothetical protein